MSSICVHTILHTPLLALPSVYSRRPSSQALTVGFESCLALH
jgi:hypothetical protein